VVPSTIRSLLLICALLGALLAPKRASADGYFGPDPNYSPSVFSYAFDGFWVGALVGTAGGYLVVRGEDFHGPEWRPLVMGAGIGALAGAGTGLTLGFIDLAAQRPGVGGVVLRDMFYGTAFGVVVGALTGALVMIKTDDVEHIALGAAAGTIAGAGLGMVVGFIEGPRIVNSPAHRYRGFRLAPSFALARDQQGGLMPLPSLRGEF
jgi:hypothetical protein